jgi:hypothetical protein
MKVLVGLVLAWTFLGSYMYDYFGGIDFVLSVNMAISSIYAVKYFDSKWTSLLLLISIPNFLNELIPLLNITPHTTLLSTATTIFILVASYLPRNLIKWN